MTVGSRINARLEHLFWDFENNCIKLDTNRPILCQLSCSLGTSGKMKFMRIFACGL